MIRLIAGSRFAPSTRSDLDLYFFEAVTAARYELEKSVKIESPALPMFLYAALAISELIESLVSNLVREALDAVAFV